MNESLFDRCGRAVSNDDLKMFAADDGLYPAFAQWTPDGRLLEVKYISIHSGEPAAHYRYDR